MAWGLLCIPHLWCHTQTLPITGLWPDPQHCCNPLLKVISTRWLGQFGLCQITSVFRKYPVLYPSAALDLMCVYVHMQCLFTPSVSFLILGFQMHARFLLNASSRDHYRWSPKVSMAVAVPWWWFSSPPWTAGSARTMTGRASPRPSCHWTRSRPSGAATNTPKDRLWWKNRVRGRHRGRRSMKGLMRLYQLMWIITTNTGPAMRGTWHISITPGLPSWADRPARAARPAPAATAAPPRSKGCWGARHRPGRAPATDPIGQSGRSPSSRPWSWTIWRGLWKRTWRSTSLSASSAGSASAGSARRRGPCPPAWPATGSACARPRAWWSTAPACAWSKGSSTTVPTTMKGTRTRIIPAPAPSHTAVLGTCAWEPCPCSCLACSVTLRPKDA